MSGVSPEKYLHCTIRPLKTNCLISARECLGQFTLSLFDDLQIAHVVNWTCSYGAMLSQDEHEY